MATVDYLEELPVSILNQDPTSNVGKLWRLFSIQMDLLNVEIEKVYLLYVISQQSGVNLDQIGKLVRVERLPGQSDIDYRVLLYAGISSTLSGGSIPEILNTINIIKDGDASKIAKIIELFPANILLYTNMPELIADNSKVVNDTRAAGVGLYIKYIVGNNPFVFADDPDGQGFSDLATFFLALDTGDTLILDDGSEFIIVDNNPSDNGGEFVELF